MPAPPGSSVVAVSSYGHSKYVCKDGMPERPASECRKGCLFGL